MANDRELNSNERPLPQWVDNELAKLGGEEWQPDAGRAYALFKAKTVSNNSARQKWIWVAAAVTSLCIALAALPGPRVFAERCAGACRNLIFSSGTPSRTLSIAPDFTLHDSTGGVVRLSNYKGKVVVLNFWATWCPPCRTEIPWFSEFERNYAKEGLTVIGVAMNDDGWRSVLPYMKQLNVSYPIALGDASLADEYGAKDLPMTLLIDRDGQVVITHPGVIEKTQFEEEITRLLRK